MADVLPGYVFDRSVARYRNTARGQFVSRQRILDLLDRQINSAERRLGAIVTAMHEKTIAPGMGQTLMRDELRRLHLQNRALAVGGIDKLTFRDFGAAGGRLRDDYGRIANLARDIANGRVSLPQALNRVQGYAGNARIQFFEGEREGKYVAANSKNMALLMIRDLGVAEHCRSCVDYYRQGWQPDLPPPGTQSECGSHCRCGLRYREVPIEQASETIGTRR